MLQRFLDKSSIVKKHKNCSRPVEGFFIRFVYPFLRLFECIIFLLFSSLTRVWSSLQTSGNCLSIFFQHCVFSSTRFGNAESRSRSHEKIRHTCRLVSLLCLHSDSSEDFFLKHLENECECTWEILDFNLHLLSTLLKVKQAQLTSASHLVLAHASSQPVK